MVRRRPRAVSNHGALAILRDAASRLLRMRVLRARRHSAAFGVAEGWLRNLQIVPMGLIGQCLGVAGPLLPFIAAAFLLAGFVKGVIGLGLPTVAMGLLAGSMPPAHAMAIVLIPAIVTNIVQTFVGPYLRDIMRRLWTLMAGTAVGIWFG